MKHTKLSLLALASAFALAIPVYAGARTLPSGPERLTPAAYETASPLSVSQGALRTIVYRASMFAGQVNFEASIPQLLAVYREHPDPQYRILAMAALHAIGNDYAMRRLADAAQNEPDARVRHLTENALADHFASR